MYLAKLGGGVIRMHGIYPYTNFIPSWPLQTVQVGPDWERSRYPCRECGADSKLKKINLHWILSESEVSEAEKIRTYFWLTKYISLKH